MPTQHDETLLERYQREELEHEYYMAKRIAELEAEVLRLKTVPMKYRRMQFNAELQEQVAELEAQLAERDRSVIKANEQAERFEREWYLRGDELDEAKNLLLLAKDVIENAVVMVAHQDNIDYLQEALATINDSKLVEGLILCDAEVVCWNNQEDDLSDSAFEWDKDVSTGHTTPLYAPRRTEK